MLAVTQMSNVHRFIHTCIFVRILKICFRLMSNTSVEMYIMSFDVP